MLERTFQKEQWEAGCDEAGRGCLAGPVFASAVIFPHDFYHSDIGDSKKLSPRKRESVRKIIEKESLAFCVKRIEPEIIDSENILRASMMAMHACIEGLCLIPSYLIIDGNYFIPYSNIPHSCLIKGDSRFLSIAAASILAKTYRDDYMRGIDADFPQYQWRKNKGYPTVEHRRAIFKWGLSPYHRKSFKVRLS
jgi:ribonuclease HII